MNKKEQDFAAKLKHNGALPEVVEKRINAAYTMIRAEGEGNGMKHKKRKTARAAVGIAAACGLFITVTTGVLAASGYFEKFVNQKEDSITYEFSINYDLVPGEFEVKAKYLPEGYKEQEKNKYWKDDNIGHGISILPIYSANELKQCEELLSQDNIEQVEKTVLNGMEAHVITYQEAEKYKCPTNIFLFNSSEGYVAQIYGDYSLEVEELKKVADSLEINRTKDVAYETADEEAARLQEEEEEKVYNDQLAADYQALREAGIPKDKMFSMGTQGTSWAGDAGYTVNSYEYLTSGKDLAASCFYDYSEVSPWLNEDGSLKPYTRQTYQIVDDQSKLVKEETIEQVFLKVNITAKCYKNNWDAVPFDASLIYTKKLEDGSLTWADGTMDDDVFYQSVPAENHYLQTDGSCIWFSEAANLEGDERVHQFFWRNMEVGEELTYDIVFVVDKDRMDQFVLSFNAFSNSPWNGVEGVNGYFLLEE